MWRCLRSSSSFMSAIARLDELRDDLHARKYERKMPLSL